MEFYQVIKFLSLCMVTLTTICYFYQLAYLFIPFLRRKEIHKPEKLHRYAVLIAARNEETVIPHLLDSIRAQDYPAEFIDIYVVADNCTDRTAEVAANHGARVFPRFNQRQVGKGYAISFLLDQIQGNVGLDCYDAFLIFDADNLLEPNYITHINKTVSDGFEAFCGYRNTKNFGTNWLSGGYGLWYLHDSTHLNRSRMMIGTTCTVNGTGFGFRRELLERMGGWNFHTLTEDIEFNTWCASHGVRIGYCHDAICYDEQPESMAVSWRQRTRWTQGGLQVSVKYAKDLFLGLFKGLRTSYACLETLTLSLWGYGMTTLSFGLTLLLTFLAERWLGLGQAIVFSLVGSYFSLLAIGLLTLATEWKRIHATKRQKIKAAFGFPLFMLTFLPISLTALFRKFQWHPVEHKVAISTAQLQKQ